MNIVVPAGGPDRFLVAKYKTKAFRKPTHMVWISCSIQKFTAYFSAALQDEQLSFARWLDESFPADPR